MGTWIVTAHTENVSQLRRFLAPPPEASPIPEAYGWLFRAPSDARPVTEKMVLRSPRGMLNESSPPDAPYPLFTGSLQWRLVSHNPAHLPAAYRVSAHLNLNGLRFARHQWAYKPGGFARAGHAAICRGITPIEYNGEIPLDTTERDNWVPTGGRMFPQALAPERWEFFIRDHLARTEAALETELERAALRSQADIIRTAHFSVKSVEVAFDFHSENPLGQLNALESAFRQVAGSFRLRRYVASGIDPTRELESNAARESLTAEHGVDLNSPSWTFYLGRGLSLKVYAKTTRRIRFELAHTLLERDIRHVFQSRAGVLNLLRELRGESAQILSRMFERLRALRPPVTNPSPPFGFLVEWFASLPSDCSTIGQHLLRLLAYNQCIRLAENDPMRRAVLALRRHGLLVRPGGSYVVAPRWHSAFIGLRSQILADAIPQARLRRRPTPQSRET